MNLTLIEGRPLQKQRENLEEKLGFYIKSSITMYSDATDSVGEGIPLKVYTILLKVHKSEWAT